MAHAHADGSSGTDYDPTRTYRAKLPATWWLKRAIYVKFVVREVTSLFTAIFCVLLLVQLAKLAQGQAAYEGWLATMKSPGMIALNVVCFLATCYHAYTWWILTAQIMPIQLGEKKVPREAVAGGGFAAWFVVSAAVAYLLFFRG